MAPELAAAVENAYRAFTRYRLKGAIEVCRCNVCVAPEIEGRLLTVPLREMSSLLVAEYVHSAHGFDDRTADEMRYFLPRMFELIAMDAPPSHAGVETCLGRLHEARYRETWPAAERKAVDDFMLALFRAKLNTPVEIDETGLPAAWDEPVENILCMAAYAGADVDALLATWDAEPGNTPALHIAAIVSSANWMDKKLKDVFWMGSSTQPHVEGVMNDVIAWLLRFETWQRLEAACLAEQDPAAAALLSHAEGLVAGLITHFTGRSDQP